jgi:hypothetical protein
VTELLLFIIVACLLFGSAAVLGFLEAAFWLILFLAVLLIVVLVMRAVVKGAIGAIRVEDEHPNLRQGASGYARTIHVDWEDHIRESRRARHEAQRCRAENRELVPAGDWHIADDVADRVANSLRRLRAVSVLSPEFIERPKGEFAEEAGRPLPPEIAALVQILLHERPDLRDYILDELWRKGWRVEGL